MARQTVLVVEDDPDIVELLRYNLEREGYVVHVARDGEKGLNEVRRRRPDVVLLDLMLPEVDGIEVCRRLRASEETASIPVLMLTAKGEETDMVLGLEMGADDYVTKPFSPRELVARVKAMLRRTPRATEPAESERDAKPLSHGPLTLDPLRHECRWKDAEVELTATEFMLLRALLAHPERVYTRAELVDRAYGLGHHITDRTVDSHVRRIRARFAALGVDPIETVYGVGYRMQRKLAQR